MWEANDRPSISSVLHQLYSLLPPNTISAADNTDGLISFDHTDSLGHVVVEVELDETDIDSDLMEFLLAAQVSLCHVITHYYFTCDNNYCY